MKKIIFLILFTSIVSFSNAQLPLEVSFDNESFLPLQLRYGPNDNPAQQDTNYTVRVFGGKAHYISSSSTAQVRLSGFLDLPQTAVPIVGSMNHRWTFTNVDDFNSLGINGVAGCYIRGEMNYWTGGMFGDYWFGMIVTATGKVSGIRQGSTNLQAEPFTATDSVSYEIRKISDTKLQLWAKYDNGMWHQVANEITITLNASTPNANYNIAVTHVRIMNNNGNAVDVSVDNMIWWQPSTSSVEKNMKGNISIYPNPATDNLNIKNLLPTDKVRVVDIIGKEITLPLNSSNIDVSRLPQGIYILHIINLNENIAHSIRFVKQ